MVILRHAGIIKTTNRLVTYRIGDRLKKRGTEMSILLRLIILIALASSLTTQAAEVKNKTTLDRAMFAAGCFWKTQYVFSKVPGVVKTTVGYSGGKATNPSYKQVCSNQTGHSETVLVEYDPRKVTFHKLLEVFWSNH